MSMGWKAIHRWLGLTLGALALVLGLSGALLTVDPVQQAWQAPRYAGITDRQAHPLDLHP